jgi:mycofactocin system creatininase family protein
VGEPQRGALASMTWPEVGRSVLAVPLGSTEQHGPHLPLSTDTMVATALAERLAEARDDVVVAPPLPYGSSGEHAGFPGTLSIGQRALEVVLVELGRSADDFAGLVFVNGHGGNAAPLHRAVTALTAEGRRAMAWSPRVVDGDAHAGRTETSLLLAIAPHLVRAPMAAAGATAPLAELLPALRAGGVQAVSANGILGDPEGASATEGRALLDELTADLVATVARWSRE